MRRLILALGLVLGSCSFTTATGFDECQADAQCAASSVCVQHYCLPMPDGCERTEGAFDKGDRIVMAAIAPLTTADGGVVERETYRLNALRLALQEANQFGGLKNSPFALVTCNATRDDAQVQSFTAWLVENLRVPAIIVSGSSRVRAAAAEPTRLDAGTFIISANATSASLVGVFARDGNVWRVAPPDTLQAKVLRALVSDAGVARSATVALVNESSDYGSGLQLALNDELTAAGFTVKATPYDPPLDSVKANAVVASLETNAPVATIVIGFPADVVQIISLAANRPRLQSANGHRWFFTDSAKDPAILTTATRAELTGLIGTTPAQGVGTAFRTFRDSFSTRYGVDPSTYSFTAHTYDAMWLTLASMAYSQAIGVISGPGMRQGMLQVSANTTPLPLVGAKWSDVSSAMLLGTPINVDGSSGELVFDPAAGAPSSPYEVWTVADAGITTLRFAAP
jgi:branched-chain amino acid transport system substrate-binding protein